MTESKALAPMETFMERVKTKLRDDIGSLLPDEVVSEMVKRVIEEEFFKPRIIPKPGRSSYSSETELVPTGFQEMIVTASKPIIERHVLRIMVERADEIERQIKETVEHGITRMFLQQMDSAFASALQNHSWTIQQAFEQMLRNRGGLAT